MGFKAIAAMHKQYAFRNMKSLKLRSNCGHMSERIINEASNNQNVNKNAPVQCALIMMLGLNRWPVQYEAIWLD